ncbi:MAG: DUF4019 domain-containing protein [Candidatus Didemnitutus sp.]|nr:DUF4019 domain-containing protein [Candidatus Didemnitutus sp.]
MKTPVLRLVLAAACLSGIGLAQAAENEKGNAEQAAAIAVGWLTLIDNYDYAGSLHAACASFKGTATEERWVGAMNRSRKPLGHVGSRAVIDAVFSTKAPRAPVGAYWIVRFNTTFEGARAQEVVTLAQDEDGQWRVQGFFIRAPD